MLIIEHRRLRGEPMRNLHRECLSDLIRLMPREHQSFQLRGHFPRYDTRWPANSSTDRGLASDGDNNTATATNDSDAFAVIGDNNTAAATCGGLATATGGQAVTDNGGFC